MEAWKSLGEMHEKGWEGVGGRYVPLQRLRIGWNVFFFSFPVWLLFLPSVFIHLQGKQSKTQLHVEEHVGSRGEGDP